MHMMHPPMIHVVHPSGAPIGSAQDVVQNPDLLSAGAVGSEDAGDVGDEGDFDAEGDLEDDDFGDDDFGDDDLGEFD
jgi:hypothetical protein